MRFLCLAGMLTAMLLAGCNTLSSIGVPVGGKNSLIDPAERISDRPGRAFSLPRELALTPMPEYRVEIGDTILIEPVKFDATVRLPGDQIVMPDGTISLGEFGSLDVANKTLPEIQSDADRQIQTKLRADLERSFAIEQSNQRQKGAAQDAGSNPSDDLPLDSAREQEALIALERRIEETILKNKVSARLVNWESKKIYVLGEVNSPGAFPFRGNETVLDGIIEAGGLSSRANHHNIIVARPTPGDSCRIVMKICYDQIVQLGDTSTNYQLLPGDRVFVPSMTFCEDLKTTLFGQRYRHCPRCSVRPEGCQLPTDCDTVPLVAIDSEGGLAPAEWPAASPVPDE